MADERTELVFTATDDLVVYRGAYAFANGDVKSIPVAEAKRLLTDFPKNFSQFKAAPATPIVVDAEAGLEEDIDAPEKAIEAAPDKSIKKGKTK